MFLYSKSDLQPNSLPPKPEVLPALKVEFPRGSQTGEHERQLGFYLAKTKRGEEQLKICDKLLAEQEVQALAIDSAQENVDKHYAYIASAYEKFQSRFLGQMEDNERLLANFTTELEKLERTETHGAVRESGIKTVGDLVPRAALCEWHAQCQTMHAQFKPKAEELSSLFRSVKQDVEALFMTVPSVDITKLSERLQTNHQLLVEMSSICEWLEKDWGMAMDHIPRVEECSKILERFTKHCVDCKNAMSRCVHSQMKSVAVLQNRISVTRNKLSAYTEVAKKIEDACAHLRLVYRIPEAYSRCLGEVKRRVEYSQKYSQHAQKFAERMAELRQKEEVTRHNFEQQYDGLLPQEVIFALNLHVAPPICEVHVSGGDED